MSDFAETDRPPADITFCAGNGRLMTTPLVRYEVAVYLNVRPGVREGSKVPLQWNPGDPVIAVTAPNSLEALSFPVDAESAPAAADAVINLSRDIERTTSLVGRTWPTDVREVACGDVFIVRTQGSDDVILALGYGIFDVLDGLPEVLAPGSVSQAAFAVGIERAILHLTDMTASQEMTRAARYFRTQAAEGRAERLRTSGEELAYDRCATELEHLVRQRRIRADATELPVTNPRATLVLLMGPPSAGKYTTAVALAERTGWPVWHNHLSIDLLRPVFPGASTWHLSPARQVWKHRLLTQIRLSTLTAAAATATNLIFTFGYSGPVDDGFLADVLSAWHKELGRVCLVQLVPDPDVSRRRVTGASRVAMGKITEVAELDRVLREKDMYAPIPFQHLRLDNSALTPDGAASLITAHHGLSTKRGAM